MSFALKPCSHCGGSSFHVLPDVQLEPYKATTVMGMTAGSKVGGWWRITMVVCAQCTRTDMFTTNIAELAPRVSGAYMLQATR
jgi:hypothetical protein